MTSFSYLEFVNMLYAFSCLDGDSHALALVGLLLLRKIRLRDS
jgi:hypothetical protein